MKRFLTVALLGLAVAFGSGMAMLGGCSTVGSSPGVSGTAPNVLSPVQVAAIACPQVNLVHVQLVAFNAALAANQATADLGRKATAQLDVIHPMVQKVCNGSLASAGVNLTDIQTLVQTGLPALGTLASTLPLPPAQQAQVQGALVIAETAAGVVSALRPQPWAVPAAAVSSGPSSGPAPLAVAPSVPAQ